MTNKHKDRTSAIINSSPNTMDALTNLIVNFVMESDECRALFRKQTEWLTDMTWEDMRALDDSQADFIWCYVRDHTITTALNRAASLAVKGFLNLPEYVYEYEAGKIQGTGKVILDLTRT